MLATGSRSDRVWRDVRRLCVADHLLAQDAHLDHALAHAAPKVVLAAPEFVVRLETAVARVGGATRVVPQDPDAAQFDDDVGANLAPLAAESPAMLMYTSGTTGTPKGVLLTHANMLAAGRAVAGAHALMPRDRVLSSLPLYHINGQCIATVSPLVSGGSIVMPHRFSVSQWWPLRCASADVAQSGSDDRVVLLNGAPLTAAQADACRAVRFARSASAPLPPEQHRAFEARFGIGVLEALGLTECASVAFANPLDAARRKVGSCGMPLGVEARVVGPDGEALPDDARGEIEVRGDNVMAGYYRAADETAKTLRPDGWLRTGDLGYRDSDGFYFITGRLKELIIKGGENIAPREIDEALLRHPAVLEGAAVGVPDVHYGQEVLACVVVVMPRSTRRSCARIASVSSAATRRQNTCVSSPSCRKARRARCSGASSWRRRRDPDGRPHTAARGQIRAADALHDLLHVRVPLRHPGDHAARKGPLHPGQPQPPREPGRALCQGFGGHHEAGLAAARFLPSQAGAAAASSSKSSGTRRSTC